MERVLSKLGSHIVLGTPLGIGKPNALLNALYRRAKADSSLKLDIITALSLNPPFGKSELEERFYRPIRRRVWDHVPRLAYLDDSNARTLPENVRLMEFYTQAGAIIGNASSQQNYISSNYTHVARDMIARGINLLMQAVAVRKQDGLTRYSLSSNPDVTVELLRLIAGSGREVVTVAQVNRALPWFGHACEVQAEQLHYIVDDPSLDHAPFAVPHEPIDEVAWAIGLRAAGLVRDDGTLQVGIGALGDAVCHALRIRQRENFTFMLALDALGRDLVAREVGGDGEFDKGLYVASEMISDALFALFEEGIVRRRVYEDPSLQQLALDNPKQVPKDARGTSMQGAFFLGPADLYRRLAELPEAQRELIDMNSVAEVNRIYTHYTLEHLQRRHARFINMTLKVSVLGAAVSDQLEDGKVLSGVGGQNDFVTMAQQLPGARSILLFRATSQRSSKVESNVVWQYGHTTIPRHMRDIFVTEYGVADLRSKTDSECIEAMLCIADSRFQEGLLDEAKRAGKVARDLRIPDACRNNTPERIARALTPFRDQDVLPSLPFGSDITAEEWAISARLKKLALASSDSRGKARLMRAMSAPASADEPEVQAALAHLELSEPDNTKERLLARLVRAAYRL